MGKRWEIAAGHNYEMGIREDMSLDSCLHSIFGAIELAADIMVARVRGTGMRRGCFREAP